VSVGGEWITSPIGTCINNERDQMRTIHVKDSEWYRVAFNMPNKITVYVNETKAEHMARRKAEYDKLIEDRHMGYLGFDEHNQNDWDEVR